MNRNLVLIVILLVLFSILSVLIYQEKKDTTMEQVEVNENSRIVEGFAIQDLETGEVYATKDAKFERVENA